MPEFHPLEDSRKRSINLWGCKDSFGEDSDEWETQRERYIHGGSEFTYRATLSISSALSTPQTRFSARTLRGGEPHRQLSIAFEQVVAIGDVRAARVQLLPRRCKGHSHYQHLGLPLPQLRRQDPAALGIITSEESNNISLARSLSVCL